MRVRVEGTSWRGMEHSLVEMRGSWVGDSLDDSLKSGLNGVNIYGVTEVQWNIEEEERANDTQ